MRTEWMLLWTGTDHHCFRFPHDSSLETLANSLHNTCRWSLLINKIPRSVIKYDSDKSVTKKFTEADTAWETPNRMKSIFNTILANTIITKILKPINNRQYVTFALLDLLWDSVVLGWFSGAFVTGCTLRRLLAFRYMAVWRIDGTIVLAIIRQSVVIINRTIYPWPRRPFIAIEQPGRDMSNPIRFPTCSTIVTMSVNTHEDTRITANKTLPGWEKGKNTLLNCLIDKSPTDVERENLPTDERKLNIWQPQ